MSRREVLYSLVSALLCAFVMLACGFRILSPAPEERYANIIPPEASTVPPPFDRRAAIKRIADGYRSEIGILIRDYRPADGQIAHTRYDGFMYEFRKEAGDAIETHLGSYSDDELESLTHELWHVSQRDTFVMDDFLKWWREASPKVLAAVCDKMGAAPPAWPPQGERTKFFNVPPDPPRDYSKLRMHIFR